MGWTGSHAALTMPSPELAPFRIAKMSSRVLALVGAGDQNAVGFTEHTAFGAYHEGAHRPLQSSSTYFVRRSDADRPVLEAAAGSSIQSGSPVYQAADGKISHTGTVKVGIANELLSHPWPTAEQRYPGEATAGILQLRAAWNTLLAAVTGLELWSVEIA